MPTERLSAPSYLFTVRLWPEESESADRKLRWHGQVKHVLSGEVRYFRSPETLYKILLTPLSNDPFGMNGLGSRGEESESIDDAKVKSILKEKHPEMSTILSWRHCRLAYHHGSGTGPIPGSLGPTPRVEVSYMDSPEPFEKQFSDFDTFEAVVKWFGSNGWELAAVIGSDGNMVYYFKHAE
jgi:hypothetical protein